MKKLLLPFLLAGFYPEPVNEVYSVPAKGTLISEIVMLNRPACSTASVLVSGSFFTGNLDPGDQLKVAAGLCQQPRNHNSLNGLVACK